VTLCGAICGAEGWQDVEDYGNAKIEHLRKYLPYKNGIPSDDTVRRFFRAIDPSRFQVLFRDWIKCLYKPEKGNTIAIDGKSSRHSYDGDGNMLHMISAYATEVKLVLSQEKVSEKSNEITAIPRLLEWLDVKGSIVSIDAMGCQYSIANQILEKGGNYVFSLKGNQGNLSNDVRLYFDDEKLRESARFCEDFDKGHGRIEHRKCWVTNEID